MDNRFAYAVLRGDFNKVLQRFDVTRAKQCYNQLLTVIKLDKPDIAFLLLSKIDTQDILRQVLDSSNEFGNTLLHYAVLLNHTKLISALLSKGAYINAANEEMKTPLYVATEIHRLSLAEFLLDKGARIESLHLDHVYYAITAKSLSLVKRFLDIGVSVLQTYPSGRSLLHHAVRTEREIFRRSLESWESFEEYIKPKGNAVLIVEELLKHGALINLIDNDGKTPLYYAVKHNNPDILRTLLKYQLDINNEGNREAFKLAICGDQNTKVKDTKLFFSLGFKITVEDTKDMKLYFKSAAKGYLSVVELFIKNGTNVNLRDRSKKTALFYAVKNGQVQVAEYLLQHKAKIDCNRPGPHLLSIASHRRLNPDDRPANKLMKLLVLHGADVNIEYKGYTALKRAVECDNKELIKILLELGSNMTPRMQGQDVPMLISVGLGSIKAARILIKEGADVNAQCPSDGSTALMQSSKWSQDVGRLLLKCDADVDIQDNNGMTALHYAVAGGRDWIVKMMIENGSDINVLDNKSRVPLSIKSMICDSLDDPASIFNIFKKHIYKLQIAHLHVSQYNLTILQEKGEVGPSTSYSVDQEPIDVKKYQEEIELMKTTNIGQSNITYYTFMRPRSYHAIVKNLSKESVQQTLETGDYLTQFPHFGYMVNGHYRRGRQRFRLCQLINENRSYFCPQLTSECLHQIVSYLTNIELRKFVHSILPIDKLTTENKMADEELPSDQDDDEWNYLDNSYNSDSSKDY